MESYQTWFGQGPELSVLRMLGLFDRPADEKAIAALLKPPAIPGLTESLTDSSPTEWRAILARLRRAKLLAGEDPHNPGHLDTHPLVREHFSEQLQSQRSEAWKECNRRLYNYYGALAPQLPDSFKDVEPLFLSVICGCNAGLFREALHEVYIPRIQRGDVYFAANALGARGALLLVLVHFFEHVRWGSPVETGVGEQRLSAEDQLFILTQATLYLTATRGPASSEMRICYELAEPLCHSLNRPLLLYVTLMGRWRYSLQTEKLTATMRIAERVCSLAEEQNNPALIIGACHISAATLFHLGDFQAAREYAIRGVQIWRSGAVLSPVEDVETGTVPCLSYEAVLDWHFGEIATAQAKIAEAIALAKKLNDMHGLAVALTYAAFLGHYERNPAEVERVASDLIELSTRQNFQYWLVLGSIFLGWARSASGDTEGGIPWIEQGLRDFRATAGVLGLPGHLAKKAEALHLADRTSEALESIAEAQVLVERFEDRYWCSELHRLRGVFLAAMDAEETQIEASFQEAIRTAKEQKSVSLAKRAEATYAEYRHQKASGSGGRGFRLPL
jgi:predicted ATPase